MLTFWMLSNDGGDVILALDSATGTLDAWSPD